MEYATLNNGVKMPMIGYGTYRTPPSATERCVAEAIGIGYRSIDTAQCYGNEREVGRACRAADVPRAELFVTTKLWGCRGYKDSMRSIDESLRRLDLGYIDLLLIHEPTGDVHEIYRAMEDACRQEKVRAIGVSNFLADRYLDLLRACAIVPAVNQVETHVFRQQRNLRCLETEHGTAPESWSPLASGENNIFGNPVLVRVAKEHRRSVSQVALRFLLQQGIIIIPKSMRRQHMAENLEALDFALTPQDMTDIEQLEEGRSLFDWW